MLKLLKVPSTSKKKKKMKIKQGSDLFLLKNNGRY